MLWAAGGNPPTYCTDQVYSDGYSTRQAVNGSKAGGELTAATNVAVHAINVVLSAGTHSTVNVFMQGHADATPCRALNRADNSCHMPDSSRVTCHTPLPVRGDNGNSKAASSGRMFVSKLWVDTLVLVVITLEWGDSVKAGTCVGPNTTPHKTATLAGGADIGAIVHGTNPHIVGVARVTYKGFRDRPS